MNKVNSKQIGGQIQAYDNSSSNHRIDETTGNSDDDLKMVGRKPAPEGEKKEVNVKVKRAVHQRLKRMLYSQHPKNNEKLASDLGDLVEKLLDFWEKEHHKQNG
ncbi:MAG: hypothetical protein M3247_08670 [Thermoproteota archaeon]|nr:hypothetical protein [Thermoproteota archaeon]